MPYFLSLGADRDLSTKLLAAILIVAKFVYIEKLEEVRLIFSKYQSTLLPLIQSGDRLEFVMPGQKKRDGQQTFVLFKSRRELTRAHES